MVLTHKRNLRTGTPVRLAHGIPKLHISSHAPKTAADVIVVGTGISGALTADALLNAGYSVLAIDRRKPMSGSTPASTALLQSELDMPLTELQGKIGKSNAARVWLRSAQAVQALKDRVGDLKLECEFINRTTLYLPGNVLDVGGLKHENEARRKLGLRSTFIGRAELAHRSGLKKAGAILIDGNAEADPAKLVAALWRSFLKRGGQITSGIEITDVDQSTSRVELKTADGQRLHAKHVVFCTGYEVLKFAKPKGYKVISTWVLATKPQPKNLWKDRSLIWEAADPYLYLRTTADGRIIVGGEDEDFSDEAKRDALLPVKVAAIARKAQKLLPEADFTADFSWAGSFGESPTSLPAIGPLQGLSRCYAVLGFGGNGITFSMLAAQLVSRHIQGISDPDAELFAL